ncbi:MULTISPECIES: hypothetical protein [Ochrobactrum]|uniref:Uncharacterized protein n=1 Tax=Ochrobactrum quorumnocens TaxID=271865 RepID=A0A5N1JVV5_9HYPH|nr:MULTISPECIES: hypothetical protein [Brucella/Ochrobactrum group]KAA9368267.1 hypothetical protein F3W84_10270 [[Ochrobactrum] quorumnocens]MBD7991834.1 hypothetical protein [Ochrobactrum gallinarum]MDH7792464.1 transcription elongation factor Elf1 [Ochrobactrum sp. AN78]
MIRAPAPKCGFCGKLQFRLQSLSVVNCPHSFPAIVCSHCDAVVAMAAPQSLQLNPLSAENEA